MSDTGSEHRGPAARSATIRDDLRRHLRGGWSTAAELSGLVGIPEKSVPEHLEHLRRSTPGSSERFEIEPASCNACGFEFDARKRLTRPSRCPKCKSERIDPPRFRIR